MNNHQIIKSLCDYYDRASDTGYEMPEYGFTFEKIRFSIVIDTKGKFLSLVDHGKDYMEKVPYKPDGSTDSPFLWGKPAFVIGFSLNIDHMGEQFYKKLVNFKNKNKYINAIIQYLDKNICDDDFATFGSEWAFIKKNALNNNNSCNIIFQVKDGKEYIRPHMTDEVLDNAKDFMLSNNNKEMYCPISDEVLPVALSHKLVFTAAAVSYGVHAFESYGFERGEHCSISSEAMHKYVQAMYAISREGNNFNIGGKDGITVSVWTDSKNPNDYAKEIVSIFKSDGKVRPNTKFDPDDGDVNCYLLGTFKNMKRLSFDFFEVIPLSVLYENLNKFLDAMKYKDYGSEDYLYVPIWDIVDNYIKTSMSTKSQEKVLITSMFIKTLLCGENGGKLPAQFLRNFSIRLEEKLRSGKTISTKSAVVAKFLLDNCQYHKEYDKMAEEMNVGEAYGRAYALYEQMYKKYLQDTGEKKASIDYKVRVFRMKYFTRAMKNPNVIVSEIPQYFSRILHSVCRDGGGIYFFFENKIKELLSGVNPAKKTYTSVETAAFAVGYNDESQYKKKSEEETV